MNNIIDETTKYFQEVVSEEVKERFFFGELEKTIEDMIDNCLKESPWEHYMREPTEEERESVKHYIDSISKPTDIGFDEIIDKLSQVPEIYTVSLEELRKITNEVNNNSDED